MMEEVEKVFLWLGRIGWNGGFVGLASLLVIIMAAVLIFGRKKQKTVQKIHLSELSSLWAREGTRTIHISELSPLWRDQETVAEEVETVELQNPRATAFMEKIETWSWFTKFPRQKTICTRILMLLDKEGHCPSVVDLHGDVEGGWDENTYRLLARTNLLDHSLNVAEEAVELLCDAKAWHVIPDTMIAALAHDLGKLESLRGYLYSLGEHPVAAERPLAAIAEFSTLPKKNEILQAIKLHHKKPRGLLGTTLKKADQRARQKELDTAVQQTECNNPVANTTVRKTQKEAVWQAQADIYDEAGDVEPKKVKESPQLMDISAWFDSARFLDELKPYINKLYGRRFLAFSMSDGHVYFQAKVLEEVARRMAQKAGCMEIANMAQRDTSMRDVLFTIVQQLRAEDDVIARGLIKDTFFGGYFNVTRQIGRPIKGYYTPFHAEAFGSIAVMEQAKPQMLRDIIKVSPSIEDTLSEDECR